MDIQRFRKVHFIAIGGIGMSALAGILLDRGYLVSGSDQALNHLTADLARRGAKIYQGQDAGNITDPDLVVVSSAIRRDNPERLAAESRGIPVWHRAELLGALLEAGEGIGITGSHGKTTTSAMLTLVLLRAGLDPTAILGGELQQLGSNARNGSGRYVVAEVDESDGTFVELKPCHAIVTNIEMDHLDHYASLEEIVETFCRYLAQIPQNGVIVLGIDCPQTCRLARSGSFQGRRVITSAVHGDADVRAQNLRHQGVGVSFDLLWKGEFLGKVHIQVPGEHNVKNALCCIALCLELGIPFATITDALAEFKGSVRRFQQICFSCGIRVIDEYAHHPTEIRASLAAARELKPQRIIAVFQPHLYSRTRLLLEEFACSFVDADLLVLTDIYGSREDPEPGVDGSLLFEAVKRADSERQVIYIAEKTRLAEELYNLLQEGDLVMMLGAGDINRVSTELCQRLSC